MEHHRVRDSPEAAHTRQGGQENDMITVLGMSDTSQYTDSEFQELVKECTSGSWGQKDPERLITVCRPDQECSGMKDRNHEAGRW